MGWKLAPSLVQLLSQVNAKWPTRSKSSDGTIGDTAHSSRASDHNPDGRGYVCALDITHDPLHGLDSEKLAEALRGTRDERIKYIISNRKICSPDRENWTWRPYKGANPHNHHVHISVHPPARSDDEAWDLTGVGAPSGDPAKYMPPPRTLSLGKKGSDVMELQRMLRFPASEVDGFFGPKTKAAVQQFQKAHGLVDDGICGAATWAKLRGDE